MTLSLACDVQSIVQQSLQIPELRRGVSSFANLKLFANSQEEYRKEPICFEGSLYNLIPHEGHWDHLGRIHRHIGGISAPYAHPLRLMGSLPFHPLPTTLSSKGPVASLQ